jgi:5-methylcytosine-specific restriction endonuclease McrA
METRVCTKCGLEKDIEQFPFRNRLTQRRQSYCIDCRREYGASWYERNKDYQKANSKKHRIEYREALRAYVWEYLSTHPCQHCGESDPIVLEFHHVGQKTAEVAVLIGRGSSLERLKAEMEQCIVLCSNCHTRLTAKERGYYGGRK